MNQTLTKAVRAAIQVAKPVLRPLYRMSWGWKASPWARRLMTDGYGSGQVALGERNHYGFYGRWITVDMKGADFNVDFFRHEKLPFGDGTQKVVYSAHMIEHVDIDTLRHLLKEACRILRPGGFIRLEAPDCEKLVKAYKAGDVAVFQPTMDAFRKTLVGQLGWDPEFAEMHLAFLSAISSHEVPVGGAVPIHVPKAEIDAKMAALSFDDFLAWCVSLLSPEQKKSGGHVNPLYPARIERLLKEAGFGEVAFMEPRRTRIPDVWIDGIERTTRASWSFFVEARKPEGR